MNQSRKHEIWKARKRADRYIKASSFVFSSLRAFVTALGGEAGRKLPEVLKRKRPDVEWQDTRGIEGTTDGGFDGYFG